MSLKRSGSGQSVTSCDLQWTTQLNVQKLKWSEKFLRSLYIINDKYYTCCNTYPWPDYFLVQHFMWTVYQFVHSKFFLCFPASLLFLCVSILLLSVWTHFSFCSSFTSWVFWSGVMRANTVVRIKIWNDNISRKPLFEQNYDVISSLFQSLLWVWIHLLLLHQHALPSEYCC